MFALFKTRLRKGSGADSINKRIPLLRARLITLVMLALCAAPPAQAQSASASLYRRLAAVGIDRTKIFAVRDASIDREDLHLSLNDGVIAFLEPVEGKVTGALFVGEGEVLVVPPSYQERQSLALFTGVAVLSEKFSVAYFRFNDTKFMADLEPGLRQAEEPQQFFEQYNSLAKTLSEVDALRTTVALLRAPGSEASGNAYPEGNFLRARLSGNRLGTFDVSLDTDSFEQVSAGQVSYTPQGRFYDLWLSYQMRSARARHEAAAFTTALVNEGELDKVVITNYRIKASVRPPTDLSGEAVLDIEAREAGDRAVLFELSRSLKLSSVQWLTSDGPRDLEFIQNEALEGSQLARRGNDVVAVVFPQPLAVGQKARLSFTYSGAVLSDAGNGLLYVGARGAWYPNRGPWMSNFDIEFRYPTGWKLLATGKRISLETSGPEEVGHWRSEQPMPIAGFNLGRYETAAAKSAEGTEVEAYAARGMESTFAQQAPTAAPPPFSRVFRRRPLEVEPPTASPGRPDPARQVKSVAERAAATIDFLTPLLGKFPYSALAVSQKPGIDSQGWPGLIFLSGMVYLRPEERVRGRGMDLVSETLYSRLMLAHETAHQWWGDAIFGQSYRDQWLMEAMANYCALMQLEAEHPDDFHIMMEYYRTQLLTEVTGGDGKKRRMLEAGPVSQGVRLDSSKFPEAYELVAYGRGTWLLHMLRNMLRDAAAHPSKGAHKSGVRTVSQTTDAHPDALFISVLHKLQHDFNGKVISLEDLQRGVEEVLPASLYFDGRKSLDWFFTGWVEGTAVPKLSLDDVKLTSSLRGMTATATLRQADAPEQLVTSVPIYADLGTGKTAYVARVFADGSETELKLSVPLGTRRLLVDPNATVLTAK
jgi:hypothetical protein